MRRYWLPLLFIGALAFRLLRIGGEDFWYDEAFTATMAKLPMISLIHATAGDVHPPTWYLLEWIIAHTFGYSEFWLRLPSAIFSAAGVTEAYLLVKRICTNAGYGGVGHGITKRFIRAALSPHRTGLLAAGLMLFAAGMHYYGQEARMYSLLTLLVLVALRSIIEDRRLRFAPSAALILYTQNLGGLYLIPLAIIALSRWKKRAIIPLMVAGISYVPWLGVLAHQLKDVSNGFWIPPENVGGLFYWLYFGSFGPRTPDFAQVHTAILAFGLTSISIYTIREELKSHLPLLAVGFIPPVVLMIVSLVWRPLFLPRALLPSSAAILALWALGISRMPKVSRLAALSCLIPMLILCMGSYYLDPAKSRSSMTPQLDIIEQNWNQGDAVYNVNVATAISYGYYLPSQYPAYLLPASNDLSQSLTDDTKHWMGLKQREATIDQLANRGYKRIFLAWVQAPTVSDSETNTANEILASHDVLEAWSIMDSKYGKMTIYLLDLGVRRGMVQ